MYADAISVLLNDPHALADKAPWFNRAFFNHLETKPDVKAAYEGLQELIKDPAKVFGEREQRAKEAYKAGREKILNDTKKTEKKFTIDNFVRTLVSQTSPLIKKLPNKAEYGELSTRQKVRDYVERMKFINNKYAEIIYKIKDDVLAPVEKFGMDADDFGMLLEFGRNISKTKIEKPAPGGMQAKYSVEQLQHIRNKYTDEQLKIIDESLKRFHDIAVMLVAVLRLSFMTLNKKANPGFHDVTNGLNPLLNVLNIFTAQSTPCGVSFSNTPSKYLSTYAPL